MSNLDPVPLTQIANWLRREADHYNDPRNVTWANDAASTLEALHSACIELLSQYRGMNNYDLGGALTNGPFLAIAEIVQ